MEELLEDRMNKLIEINRRLELIMAKMGVGLGWTELRVLRADLAIWIKEAQEEYDAF